MNYNSITIDREQIPQEYLDISDKQRTNLFAWNGQFSPQLIETLLTKYGKKNFLVIDPFSGSGTTLYECARRNIKSIGIELNVSAFYMSKFYEICNIEETERNYIISQIEKIITNIKYQNKILDILKKEILSQNHTIVKNTLSLLIILMDIYNNDISLELLNKKWEKIKENITSLPYTDSEINAILGNAKNIPTSDSIADLLITSPPYINVFNYHQKYRRSVEELGYNVLNIAKCEIGSNRKNRSNRILTVIQYCIDMALSMQEASRICKTKARMIYIVGKESKVQGVSFCNSEIIYRIATEILNLNLVLKQERCFKNRYGQLIYEDILHFTNVSNVDIPKETVINRAKDIATEILTEKLSKFSSCENAIHIKDAISKISLVKESEVHCG